MKQGKKLKLPKYRNPHAQEARFHPGAGVHGKTKKAQRRKDKVALKKECFDKVFELSLNTL